MELHNLKPAAGSTRTNKRVGRGQGSGRGGTSTRGHKGAKSRSGYSAKRGFEGGQMPLQMRIPKRGFTSRNREEFVPMNLDRLEGISMKYGVSAINPEFLIEQGIIKKTTKIKLLAGGELSKKLEITAHAASDAAKEAIEAKGGTVNLL